MENGKKVVLGVIVLGALLIGWRILAIHNERTEALKDTPPPQAQRFKITDDDMVNPRLLYQSSLKDAKDLIGKPLWINAGGQMEFFPYTAHRVDIAHSAGVLLGAERIDVKDVIQQSVPKDTSDRIPVGNKQVFLIFTKPDDEKKQYATPVGDQDETGYTFFLDKIYFYDDPRTLYKHWSKETWDAIDKHQAIVGMTQRQTQLALGQVATYSSHDPDNSTVDYNNLGHHVKVVYENGKATSVQPQ